MTVDFFLAIPQRIYNCLLGYYSNHDDLTPSECYLIPYILLYYIPEEDP